jgi:hypothetical protein
VETRIDERGTRCCIRIIKKVIPSSDGKGSTYIDAPCNQPVTMNISTKQLVCPNCDKEPPIGWVNPRVTNTANTIEDATRLRNGLPTITKVQRTAEPIKPARKIRDVKKPVEAKMKKANKDELVFTVPLGLLEGDSDIAAALIAQASAAIDQLPVANFAESKRLMRIQEKLNALAAV